MELGLFTFGDILPHPTTGEAPSPKRRVQEIVALAKLADEVGLDVFALGEHHRLDMVVSSPAVLLGGIARETKRIKLSSATTLLNTLDPVRVYEDFATLDLLSEGRAEMIVGRGSFTESFALFGYDMKDYDDLFAEKIDLLLEINKSPDGVITWTGDKRPSLHEAEVAPRAERPIPIWVGVGGTPQSAARAGFLGLHLNLAILGGPDRFPPMVQYHQMGAAQGGYDPKALRVAVSSHGLLLDDAQEAKDTFALHWGELMKKGLRNRFPPRAVPREYLDMEMGPRGAMFAGDAKEAIEKIRYEKELLGISRLLLQFDWGGVPFEKVKRSIEILGTEVLPAVRDL